MTKENKHGCVEISIVIKNDERRQTQKFLIYEKVGLDIHDPIIDRCLHEAIANFNDEPDSVVVKSLMVCR